MSKIKHRPPSTRNKRINMTKRIAREAAYSELGYLVARTKILKNRYRLALIISVLINIGLMSGIAYAYAVVILTIK